MPDKPEIPAGQEPRADHDPQGNPFEPWAEEVARDMGRGIAAARDWVIMRGLEIGDTQPLAQFLILGHVPRPSVLKYLALMLAPDLLNEGEIKIPYKLEARPRLKGKRGPKRYLWRMLRDRSVARNFAWLIAERGPGSYEAVLKEIAELRGLTKRVVREAYDQYRRSQPPSN